MSIFHLGLIGYPLGHSLSPKIHTAALKSCGLDGNYSLYPIPPEDMQGLETLLACLRNGEITGLNVTIPHKQNVIPLLDELTLAAKAIGAVNTIFVQNGKLTGDNTDAPGFISDLKRFLSDRQSSIENQKSALVLGAGGSACAVVYALINDGWEVRVAARHPKQAQTLIDQFSNLNSRLSFVEYQTTSLYSLIFDLSLVVNTTPLGMSPNVEASPWPADLAFPRNAVVYDLIYNPRETTLVRDARAAGLSATTGLGMLIEQAALSFEIWTGCKLPRNNLYKTVVE